MYYFYVLQNIDDESDFYIGYSSNLRQRLESHNRGSNFSTKNKRWRIFYYEAYLAKDVARRRERKLKNNPRMKKLLFNRLLSLDKE